MYKVDARYAPEAEGGILWSDPDLAISWPVNAKSAHLSEKDLALPRLRDFESPF
ncbi:MAG TPA: dTDP-4-dehydrorhamnose 3,5-epimerase family protein [Xanthobacteraceae bacterium]|nr:dTDP-4-dehydrorhamnose 3,5-epimerase family protein [Xanthobacteraceae bacterium]